MSPESWMFFILWFTAGIFPAIWALNLMITEDKELQGGMIILSFLILLFGFLSAFFAVCFLFAKFGEMTLWTARENKE